MRRTILLLSASLFLAAPALAQSPYPPIRDPYLTVTYGAASRSQDIRQQGVLTVYNEVGAFELLHSVDRAAFYEIGAGARVWRGLFVGGAFTRRTSESIDAPVDAFVPHPAFYDSFRRVQATVSGVEHRETALHIQAMWRFDLTPKFQVGVFGGPTLLNVAHDLIEGFTVVETGGAFTEPSLTEPARRRESAGLFTAHGGVDAMVRVAPHVGVGAMVRYSHATTRLTAPERTSIELVAGGLDAGIRVRIGF
jgi:hypothetical protein